jgi:hypothetical protein
VTAVTARRAAVVVVAVFSVPACGGRHAGQRSRPPAQFCASLLAGDAAAAGESAHAALVAVDAGSSDDATAALAAWLAEQSCVADVQVPSVVIDTDPAIRELSITLRPDADGHIRRCHADLRLAPGARVSIHPADWNSANPDTRCTVVTPSADAGSGG